MRLLYDLPEADEKVFREASGEDEKLMYCLPFDIHQRRYVKGYLAVTNHRIYKILNGELLQTFSFDDATYFKLEVMYGSGGFYGRFGDHFELICQINNGYNEKRYAVLAKACTRIAKQHDEEPIHDDTNEGFCPKCGNLFVPHTNICTNCMNRFDVYKKIWGMTKGLRFLLIIPFVIACSGIGFSFFVPYVESIAINRYIQPAAGTVQGTVQGFIWLVVMIMFLAILEQGLSIVQRRCMAIASVKFMLMLKNLLFEKIQSLSISAIQRRTTGDLMGRINYDTNIMNQFLCNQFTDIFYMFIRFFMAFFIILSIDWKMCLMIFIPLPIVTFLFKISWQGICVRDCRRWVSRNRTNYILHDIINGIRVVKCFGQEEKENAHFTEAITEERDITIRSNVINSILFSGVRFLMNIGTYLITLYGYLTLIAGDIELGTLHQIFSYSAIVIGPLLWLTDIPKTLSNFLASASKVFEILEETPEVTDIELPVDIRIEGEIRFDDVTFGYQSYEPVLENISVNIKAGEMIGIVGHSGSGKSTFINLLMRLYNVNSGSITIDDVNINDISQEALRSQLGVVLQETFLFSGTIRDNITYAKPHANDDEVINAARIANAHDFIMSLPEGYNTYVGEKGYTLSGGERQRIAIARAVIHDPRILIPDEATASLDTETEKVIQDALNKVAANRTTIAIAHRLSTLRNADKLLVLDHGKAVEFGTHAELLANKGIYYRLVMAQQKMAESSASERALA